MMTPPAEHVNFAKQLEACRKGETIRGVECRRINKSDVKRGFSTLSLLTDEHGGPEAISVTIEPIAD